MKRISIEFVVGLFLIAGLVGFCYLAVSLGGVRVGQDSYLLTARFVSASGLKEGAEVELAGVAVGTVTAIRFDPKTFEAVVDLAIPGDARIQEDAIASIRSTGLIGGKFVKISAGGSERILAPGDEILETESSISLEELISKYIFESSEKGSSDPLE